MFIASAIPSSTRLTTNSPAPAMLRVVSFGLLPGRCCSPSTISAGSSEKTLKKLKGAAFTTPSGDRLVTSAIGRGVTLAQSSL